MPIDSVHALLLLVALALVFDFLRGFFREGDDVLGVLLTDAGQLAQVGRFEERQVIVGEEAFLDERLHDLVGDARDLPEPAFGPGDTISQFIDGHDLDVAADQLGRQPHILAATPDRQ